MTRPQKIFRIEHHRRGAEVAPTSVEPRTPASEIIEEIRALRSLIEAPNGVMSQTMVDAFRRELGQAQQMRAELEAIQEAIERTKVEIATVHTSGFRGTQMVRVTGELDAIVQGTLDATDQILTAAEHIERGAHLLEASCKGLQDRQGAADIKEQIVKIFEACNFQDLTGQRISKVVGTLKFIEDRIVRMMEIWGGIETFQKMDVEAPCERAGGDALINGPKLATDAGHASQDEIDALFE